MKLIKVKAIVIKETTYSDSDKIITLLTDKLGTITCMAKGAKRTNSSILASSQYLVYSEFILFKGSKFYYVNSANTIATFYHLRVDIDKLNLVFPVTKCIFSFTDENVETSLILRLFLNMLYVLEKMNKDNNLVINIFKIKFLCLLGYAPQVVNCSSCKNNFKEAKEDILYDFVNNRFICQACVKTLEKGYMKISFSTIIAIKYIISSNVKAVYALFLKDENLNNFNNFGQAYLDCITNGI